MYINVVVFLQENDDVEGYAADYMSLLLLHFSYKRCTGHGENRLAQRRHLVGTLYRSHVHQRRRSLQENDDVE